VRALRDAGAPAPGPDRFLAPEIETSVQFVASGSAIAAAESVSGPLN
jgi:histidine ammonia-lyase